MSRSFKPAFLALLYLALSHLLHAQNAVVRTSAFPTQPVRITTPFGETTAVLTRLDPAPNLLIVVVKDGLTDDDYPEIRRLISALYKSRHADTIIRIGTLKQGSPLDIAGPFRTAPELQALLRKITPEPDAPPALDAPVFLTILADGLDPDPPAWSQALILGRIPAFPSSSAPEISQYAAAWLTRKAISQRRILMFRNLSGEPIAPWAGWAARATGGIAFEPGGDPAALPEEPQQLVAVSWDTSKPSTGFDLHIARIAGFDDAVSLTLPSISGGSPDKAATLPSLTEYIELAGLVAGLRTAPSNTEPAELKNLVDRALKLNPSDRAAVAVGLDLARKSADIEGEIALLGRALDLNSTDAAFWSRLGDLHYSRKNYPLAESALLRARELGSKDARSSEELGRMQFEKHDLPHAAEFIAESLALNPNQQDLWFFDADLAKELARAPRRTEALERALALGGKHIDRRGELIRIYLSVGDRVNAARHADLELPSLPPDADTQSTWAGFYQELSRPNDALACWKRVIAADPRREVAHYSSAAILYDQHQYPEALEASEQGLETNKASARLELLKINSLERLNRIYELRRSLEDFESADLAILRRRAEIADAFGGDAATAWRRYAEALLKDAPKDDLAKADLDQSLARGWRVCLREGDLTAAAWFEEHLRKPGAADVPAVTLQKKGVWIPGGFEALAFVAHAHPGAKSSAFLLEYCRTLVANLANVGQKERDLYQKSLTAYFEQLNRLLSMSTRKGDRATLTLSLNKQGQSQAETVIGMLGWKLRRSKDQIVIESSVKAGQSEKQDLASALAIDQAGMQSAFQAGKPYSIEIPYEWAPVVLDDAVWRAAAQADRYPGGLAEALVQHLDVARAYLGLSNVDQASASILVYDIGLQTLLGKYSQLIALYSSALAISGGHVMVPGGVPAEPVWTKLCGASPAEPARFYRGLFDKDNGKLLAWYFALSQLDPAHQRFFTRNEKRTSQFYEAFAQSADLRSGAARLSRNGTFTEFLREIPLEGESVSFPGSPEIWMVAQGRQGAGRQTDKLLKKARRVAAPDFEDQILLRLARTENTINNETFSELGNFLAVVHIDQHRQQGPGGDERALDDESALLLAQNYNELSSFYPYFSAFRELNAADLKTAFEFFSRMRAADEKDADLILGQFYALTETTRLAMELSGLPEAKANQIFRDLCKRFLSATDLAGVTAASLDTVRDLIVGPSLKTDPDNALRSTVLGNSAQLDFEWRGVPVSFDSHSDREKAFRRTVELQKAPSVAVLLRIDENVRRIASGAAVPPGIIDSLEKDVASLPSVEIPRTLKVEGHAKATLIRAIPLRLPQIVAELRQKAARKKVNPDEIGRLCRELLSELSPQVRITLQSAVYAVYLSPESILIADDPLLVRKHQTFEINAAGKKSRFIPSHLNTDSSGEGSFFEGGFARFAAESARAAVPDAGATNALYVNQIASIRATPWLTYRDDDQRLLGLRIRMAREWCVYAADNPTLLRDLSEDSLGVLSLTRRRSLLNGIASRDWESVWASLTVSDLLFLADRYIDRYTKSPWNSPVDAALRQVNMLSDGSVLRSLGALPVSLFGCNHPDRVLFAPYEEYEHHLFPEDMAERAAEMKYYLAAALDRRALPAALMPSIVESVAKMTFSGMRMSDSNDWMSAMKAFTAIDDKIIGKAIEGRK